jgi:hypothetical protein
MKSKSCLTISICLFSLLDSEAQMNNHSGNQLKDSIEILAFRRLVYFITPAPQDTKKSESEIPISHLGEEHLLVTPILTYPGTGASMSNRYSYDNFLPTTYNKEATQGSPFLLPVYVQGLVVNQLDSVISNASYLYNYDKMSGNLLLRRENEAPIAVNREQVNMFCLKVENGGFIFMRVPLINSNEFFQVIYKGSKYSSYKLYKNRFISANQKTNGYMTEGKDYDEYQDIETYFIVDERKEESMVFELTKKSIKKSLGSASAAVDQYFKDHRYEEITESFVAHLLASL